MDEIQPKSYENEDQNHNNLTEGNDEMIKNQQFNSSWQNVRINRRLQTIEDGMEQLFTMLDTLGTEQNKFDEKLSGGRKDGLDMEELNKLEARLRAKLEESGPKDIGDDDIRLKIANLEKQIKKVEDNILRPKNGDNNDDKRFGDFSERVEEIEKSVKGEFSGVRFEMKSLATREELGDYVKWTALEEALKLRADKSSEVGHPEKNYNKEEDVSEDNNKEKSKHGIDDKEDKQQKTDKEAVVVTSLSNQDDNSEVGIYCYKQIVFFRQNDL